MVVHTFNVWVGGACHSGHVVVRGQPYGLSDNLPVDSRGWTLIARLFSLWAIPPLQ